MTTSMNNVIGKFNQFYQELEYMNNNKQFDNQKTYSKCLFFAEILEMALLKMQDEFSNTTEIADDDYIENETILVGNMHSNSINSIESLLDINIDPVVQCHRACSDSQTPILNDDNYIDTAPITSNNMYPTSINTIASLLNNSTNHVFERQNGFYPAMSIDDIENSL